MTFWLLNLLPDWMFYMLLSLGLIGVVASLFLNFIPFISKYKTLIQIVSIILLIVGVWYAGAISNNNAWKQKVSELELKISESEKKASELNVLLIESLVENQKKISDYNLLNKKYLDSIRNKVDSECKIGKEVINLHNSAASNKVSK